MLILLKGKHSEAKCAPSPKAMYALILSGFGVDPCNDISKFISFVRNQTLSIYLYICMYIYTHK